MPYNVRMLGLYIHIPFCRSRCPYCDFVSAATPGTVPEEYVRALCAEIAAFEGPSDAATVFFGGGTPSLLQPRGLAAVMEAVRRRFVLSPESEVSLEANPDDVTADLARTWRAEGVNRLSLGVQSLDDRVLRYLGRRHDASGARRACEIAATHFARWSMDLIFGAPPVDAWGDTLQESLSFRPPHLSAYGLTYEDGTPFGHRKEEALEEDAALALYRQTEEVLAGYTHYEISNYALPAEECRHNVIYWRNEEYAGFGTGAYSFLDGVRSRNLAETRAYVTSPGEKEEALALTPHEMQVETVIQHMRLKAGLPRAAYRARFGADVSEHFGPALNALEQRGLLRCDTAAIRPTRTGFYLNNEIGLALVGE